MESLTQGLNLPPEKPKTGQKAGTKKSAGSQSGLAVAAVVMLALAMALMAWQLGVFEPSRGAVETPGASDPVLTYHPPTRGAGSAGGAPDVGGSAGPSDASKGTGGAGEQTKPDAPKAHEQPGRAPISPGRPGQFEVPK
jgi:hypothetical protein